MTCIRLPTYTNRRLSVKTYTSFVSLHSIFNLLSVLYTEKMRLSIPCQNFAAQNQPLAISP